MLFIDRSNVKIQNEGMQLGMGLGLAQPKAQLIWAGPGRPKSALGRKILAQTHL